MIRTGLWQNENGSRLNLVVQDDRVSGDYRTNSDKEQLQRCFPLTGFVNDGLIGFSVSWEDNKSMTSWCGRYLRKDDGAELIRCVWHLGRLYKDEAHTLPNAPWESFVTGTDLFTFIR